MDWGHLRFPVFLMLEEVQYSDGYWLVRRLLELGPPYVFTNYATRSRTNTHLRGSRSSLIIVTQLLVVILRNLFFDCQQGIYTSSSKSPVGVWIPTALLFSEYLTSYPGGKTFEAWNLPLMSSSAILWMSGTVPPFPHKQIWLKKVQSYFSVTCLCYFRHTSRFSLKKLIVVKLPTLPIEKFYTKSFTREMA